MVAVNASQPALFKYWLGTFHDSIRIEWGVHSAELTSDGHTLNSSAPVPECLRLAARDCADAGLCSDIPGCEYQGTETQEQMFVQVATRCMCCGVVQGSLDKLSDDHGECLRCRAARPDDSWRASVVDLWRASGVL